MVVPLETLRRLCAALDGARANEPRMRAAGFSTFGYKLTAVVATGAPAGYEALSRFGERTGAPRAADEVFGAAETEEARTNPGIRHFEGPGANKPWDRRPMTPNAEAYWEHRRATPWRRRWVRP